MKNILSLVAVVAIAVGGYFMLSMNYNNGAVPLKQKVERQWGDVGAAYQRRNDLIGNLVSTVKGAAEFEKSTLEAVVNARAKATSVNIDPSNITSEELAEFQRAQSGVSSALGRLLMVTENYPQLRSNENFMRLQDELASTENQILTARTRFNEAVEKYNSYILRMPNKFFLSGYTEKAFFQPDPEAAKAPEVKF